MKILLIDNHSKHREELAALFSDHATVETQDQLCDADVTAYDLIVLSGGSNVPSVFYNPEAYAKEMELIQNTKSAVLGICLGSEIVTKAFGGTLQDFGSVHRGNMNLTITDQRLEDCLGKNSLEVYEAHEVGIKHMPEDFFACAHSEHGVEIIKHKTRPIIGVQFHPEVESCKELIGWIMNMVKVDKYI